MIPFVYCDRWEVKDDFCDRTVWELSLKKLESNGFLGLKSVLNCEWSFRFVFLFLVSLRSMCASYTPFVYADAGFRLR